MTEITQLITVDNENLHDIKIDQTVICEGNFMSQMEPEFIIKPNPPLLDHTYQHPHIYYPYTEDYDYNSILSKVAHMRHELNNEVHMDSYSDDDAEAQYLQTDPISYIILGKPEIGQVEIAKMISDTWKCVNINPLKIITDELQSETRAGKCIAYNLEAGRAVEPEIILRLVEKRVKSQTVQHRGAIINGFPLIANCNYKEDIISSESAIFNVQDIFEDLIPANLFDRKPSMASIARQVSQVDDENTPSSSDLRKGSEMAEEEDIATSAKRISKLIPNEDSESEIVDLGPSDVNIVYKADKYHDLTSPYKQLKFIFKLFEGKPLLVIYVSCDNIDVVRKRKNYRFHVTKETEFRVDPLTNEVIDDTMPSPSKYAQFKEVADYTVEINGSEMKNIVKLPHHFKPPVSSQLALYRQSAKPIIDDKVLYCKPEFFMKIDGRLSNSKMFYCIDTRLKSLGFQYVLIPKRIKDEDREIIQEEDALSLNMSDIIVTKLSDLFKSIRINKQCGPMYKFGLSNWRYKCPVALKEGRILLGKGEFAVKFMNKIFFMSSEEALLKICKNPRRYLLPTIPNPTCRIWIFGPRISGKSSIAKCLSYLFNCKILNLVELERKFENSKYMEYIDKLRTAAITEALVTINENRKIERQETIDEWVKEARSLLTDVLNYVEPEISENVESDLPCEGDCDVNCIDHFEYKLKTMNLPPYSKKHMFKTLLVNEKELMKYIPEIFTRPIEPVTVFDQFVKNYVKTSLSSAVIPDMKLTFDEKVDMIKSAIQETEDEYYQVHNTRGGWIIDGMFMDTELLEKLCPEYLADDIICIKDNDWDHKFLIDIYLKKNMLPESNLAAFFNRIKRYSIAEKTVEVTKKKHSRVHIINSVMNDSHDEAKYVFSGDTYNTEDPAQDLENYVNALNEFHTKWQVVKVYLEQIWKSSLVVIDIEGKTIQDLLKEALINIENKYRILAFAMSDEDIKEELLDYGGSKDEDVEEESFVEDEDLRSSSKHTKFFTANRRLGNTNQFCPVVFDRYFVLWKGNDLFQASFADCVYYFSSESAQNEFVTDPRIFLNRLHHEAMPPPRICMIGTTGSGKTSCAKVLADNYGLHYVNFDHLILQAFDLPLDDLNYIITVNPIIDDEMQLNTDKLDMIKSYLERDTALDKRVVKQVLAALWFQEPYKYVGFVLDNFPRRPSDVDSMIENFYIPDIVIELYAKLDDTINRKFPTFMSKRKREIQKYNQIMQEEFEMKFSKWQEDRYLRLQLLLEEKWEKFQKKNEFNPSTKKLTTPINSEPNLQSEAEEGREVGVETEEHLPEYTEFQQKQDLDECNAILDKEMPVPVFSIHLPTDQEISDDFHTKTEVDYWRDLDYFVFVKQQCNDFNIPHSTVKTVKKTAEKVFYEVLHLTDQIRFRNRSFLERVYEITIQHAEKLLTQGYYFMSRFGRTCPVQRYEYKNPIQMFLLHQDTDIFPLIYRRYIYFLHTESNRDKFMHDPIKYIVANTNRYWPMIPARVAIIGPPKSGKSTLAERLEREYFFKIITRGKAMRYVLENFPHCHLAENIRKVAEAGWSATYEMSAKAVEALTLNERSITQGYILDGFPQTEEEMKQLVMIGIIPYSIIDIRVTKDMLYQNLASVETKLPFRTYSAKYIDGLYYRWERNAYEFREWLHNNYQNVKSIENDKCKWYLAEQAKPHILNTMLQLHEYLYKSNFDQAIKLTTLCITPEEFKEHQSLYCMLCPLCWYFLNNLQDGGPYPDRRNVVQYLNSYYYICNLHLANFFAEPTLYIPPRNLKPLPEDLPTFVKFKKCTKFHQDGLCIVCYWDNQPKRVLEEGSNKFIIKYRDVCYRFCSENCAKIFFLQPKKYYNLIIHYRDKNKPDLCALSKLPTLGYLEQLAGQLVIDAVINTEYERPYLAGLTIAQSAALHMGIYLKMNNPNASPESIQLYKEAKEKYDYRQDKLKRKLEHFKNRMNPFVCVDKMRTERYKYGPRYLDDDDDDSDFSKHEGASQYTESYQHTYPYETFEFEYEEEEREED